MLKSQKDVKELKKEVKDLKKQLIDSERERHKFQRLAERDFLTDIYNRHGFIRETERFLNEMNAEKRFRGKRRLPMVDSVAIMFVDIDYLKTVNDTFGHKIGDKYIKAIAHILTSGVRDIDIVGRWGGDEFAIALINATGPEVHSIAQKMQGKIAKIKLDRHIDFMCSASFGLISVTGAHHRRVVYDLHALIERADRAMYEAKENRGKGVIVSFQETI